jgi:hypothetical protein
LFFGENVTSTTIEDGIDASHCGVRTEDFDEEDGFLEGWLGEKFGCVEDAATGGDDLTSSAVDGVRMEGDVLDVETDSTHGFFGDTTFFGRPR